MKLAAIGVGVVTAAWAMALGYLAAWALPPVEAATVALFGVLYAPTIPALYAVLRRPRG